MTKSSDLEIQADNFAAERNFLRARQLLEEVVSLSPDNFTAWLKLAAMANAMGEVQAALDAASGALAIEPLDFTALMMYSMQLHALGRLDESGASYGRALAQLPNRYPPQMAPAVETARIRYHDWQQRRFSILYDAVASITSMTPKFEAFINSIVRLEPMERIGPTHYCYPGLGSAGYYDNSIFPWIAKLEKATNSIQSEFEALISTQAAQLVPYIQYPKGVPLDQWKTLNNNRDWTAIHLLQNGQLIEANAMHCPRLLSLLSELPQPNVTGAGPNAMFSLLAPGAHIPAHTGISNARLVCHLPLITPDGCWFRVADETRIWKYGNAWVFDDTIEHEAMNPSDTMRVVMIFDIWHPMLNNDEIKGIKAVIESSAILHGL